MFRLTRELRLYVGGSSGGAGDVRASPPNGHAGYPSLLGAGQFRTVRITLAGEPDEESGYVINIKEIDQIVRQEGLAILEEAFGRSVLHPGESVSDGILIRALFERFRQTWGNLERVEIALSPYTSTSIYARESPMIRFSQKFEFSAAHRLHNGELSAEENVALFGKCNNPHGHGHNYELQVTLRGQGGEDGQIMPIHQLEEIVHKTVISKFDHKFLNIECPEFAHLNPTVENIARTIYKMLKVRLSELAAVTVWETPKTWCEYGE